MRKNYAEDQNLKESYERGWELKSKVKPFEWSSVLFHYLPATQLYIVHNWMLN